MRCLYPAKSMRKLLQTSPWAGLCAYQNKGQATPPTLATSSCCLPGCALPLQTRYVRSSREIKRLDSLAMSPIFTHFSETLQASWDALRIRCKYLSWLPCC